MERRDQYVAESYWLAEVSVTAEVVHEYDDAPEPTGVLDQDGRMMFRFAEKRPIGFVLKNAVTK